MGGRAWERRELHTISVPELESFFAEHQWDVHTGRNSTSLGGEQEFTKGWGSSPAGVDEPHGILGASVENPERHVLAAKVI